MNKDIMKALGFGEQVARVEQQRCPTCGKAIQPETEFRDALSRREFNISGMCQKCQDDVFGS